MRPTASRQTIGPMCSNFRSECSYRIRPQSIVLGSLVGPLAVELSIAWVSVTSRHSAALPHFHFHSARVGLTYFPTNLNVMSTNAVVLEDKSAGRPALSNETSVDEFENRIARTERRRIDVTELDAAGLETFVEENVGTHLVSLERRGSHTYLVLE